MSFDLYFRSTFWAIVFMAFAGIIISFTIWILIYVIRPSYEKAKERKQMQLSMKVGQSGTKYEQKDLFKHSFDSPNILYPLNATMWNGLGFVNA